MRQLKFWLPLLIGAGCVSPIMAQPQPASAQPQTVWNGVYSEAQAFRGEKVAETTCLGCHGAGLAGGDSGPKLVGDKFLSDWNAASVGDLFGLILEKMPHDAPGTLKKEDVASVTAYILQLNNMPSGRQELAAESDTLAQITILAARP